jgi:hypothetical protein
MKIKSLLLLAALSLAAPASAQRLYLQNGADIEWSEVTLSGSNLQVKIRRPDGKEAISSTPASNVVRVDWPYPAELGEALTLILQKKYEAALAKASEVRTIHANWKDKPGSWYVQASLYVAECHIRLKNAAESDKVLTELRTMTLPSSQQKALLMAQALEDLERGATTPALEKAMRAAQGLEDDSALLARLSLLIGDIKFKSEQFLDALDSYLQVPVFFGAQGQLMAPAELGAARSLFKLGRLADASKYFGYISSRYKGTTEAAEAEKEKADVDKALAAEESGPAPSAAPPPKKEEQK